MADTDDAVIKTRLRNDVKALKRLIRRFQTFKHAVETGKEELWRPQLELFFIDLETFEYSLFKHQLIHDMNQRELSNYREEQTRIELEISETAKEIENLKVELEKEQKIKRNKLVYDEVAKKINEYPTRQSTTRKIENIKSNIRLLEMEKVRLDEAVEHRKKLFSNVIEALDDMTAAIKSSNDEEVSEVEDLAPKGESGLVDDTILVEEEEEGAIDKMDTS